MIKDDYKLWRLIPNAAMDSGKRRSAKKVIQYKLRRSEIKQMFKDGQLKLKSKWTTRFLFQAHVLRARHSNR
ncbi:hypothetical protein CDW43_04120 [Methylophaga nitratireducenticrescens]|nr:hypothetical protein CDW43_04120 [Methylophaga nitratireducenticrescens]